MKSSCGCAAALLCSVSLSSPAQAGASNPPLKPPPPCSRSCSWCPNPRSSSCSASACRHWQSRSAPGGAPRRASAASPRHGFHSPVLPCTRRRSTMRDRSSRSCRVPIIRAAPIGSSARRHPWMTQQKHTDAPRRRRRRHPTATLLARLFESRGFRVDTAPSGAQALELDRFGTARPGAARHEHAGHDRLRRAEARFAPPTRPGALPVVMVTGVGESQDLVEALELGANDYVTKPIDFPVALARITHAAGAPAGRTRAQGERRALRAGGPRRQRRHLGLAVRHQRGLLLAALAVGARLRRAGVAHVARTRGTTACTPTTSVRSRRRSQEHLIGSTTHFEYEHRVQSSPDAYRWVLARAVAVRDAAGHATRVAGSLTDITEGKVADALDRACPTACC